MSAGLIRDLVVAQTRALKLPGIARTFEGLARQARDTHWPHEDYLHEVLSAEQASRHDVLCRCDNMPARGVRKDESGRRVDNLAADENLCVVEVLGLCATLLQRSAART